MRLRAALWLIIMAGCGRQVSTTFDASVWNFDHLDAAVEFSDTVTSSSCWSRAMLVGPFNTGSQGYLAPLPSGDALVVSLYRHDDQQEVFGRHFFADGGASAPILVWTPMNSEKRIQDFKFATNQAGDGLVSWTESDSASVRATHLITRVLSRDGRFLPSHEVVNDEYLGRSATGVLANGDAVIIIQQVIPSSSTGGYAVHLHRRFHETGDWSDTLLSSERSQLGPFSLQISGDEALGAWWEYGPPDFETHVATARSTPDGGWRVATAGPTGIFSSPIAIVLSAADAQLFWVDGPLWNARQVVDGWSLDGGVAAVDGGVDPAPPAAITTRSATSVMWSANGGGVMTATNDGSGWGEPALIATPAGRRLMLDWTAAPGGTSVSSWVDYTTLVTTDFDADRNIVASHSIDGLLLRLDAPPKLALDDSGNHWLLANEDTYFHRLVLMHCR